MQAACSAQAIPDERTREAELARLAAAEAQRFADSRAGRYLAGHRAIARARRAGADAETIAALRREHFDAIEPGASMRLAALDATRAARRATRRAASVQQESLKTRD